MEEEEIRRALISMIQSLIPVNTTWGTVKSVSGQKCVVTVDELDIPNVLLGFSNSGVVVYPKVNTRVLIGFINNTRTLPFVLIAEETDKVELMGNSNGGIVVSKKTADKLNVIEKSINDLKNIFAAWTPVASDGGAALKTALAIWMTQLLTETQDVNLENDKIKHGNG